MKTSDFIRKHLNTSDGKERHCSSVITDGNGTFFSYGRHYPLLVNVNGLTYLNTAGYSSTTGRHISMASPYARHVYDYNYVSQGNKTDIMHMALLSAISNELTSKQTKLLTLRKNATRQRQIIEDRISRLQR